MRQSTAIQRFRIRNSRRLRSLFLGFIYDVTHTSYSKRIIGSVFTQFQIEIVCSGAILRTSAKSPQGGALLFINSLNFCFANALSTRRTVLPNARPSLAIFPAQRSTSPKVIKWRPSAQKHGVPAAERPLRGAAPRFPAAAYAVG